MKRGFTLIELVFVIVIIGVLSAILAPRFDRPSITEATHQLVSHIRYTQHLAMMDNKFDPIVGGWQRQRWNISFKLLTRTTVFPIYTIASNRDGTNNLISTDVAVDPANQSVLLSGDIGEIGITIPGVNIVNYSSKLNLQTEYGIESLVLAGSCAGRDAISFDYLGRPILGNSINMMFKYLNTTNTSELMTARCIIILRTNDSDNNIRQIAIEPETGYTHILPD